MELTLHKQIKININTQYFIERLLHVYRYTHSRDDRDFIRFELNAIIDSFTAHDLRYYVDNPLEVMQTIMKNAYFYASEHDYPQTDIDILKKIIYTI